MAITHICITGQTQSGKTLLARKLAASAAGCKPVIVYDPTATTQGPNAAGWRAAFVTSCWETFKGVFWKSRGCLVIIDEAADIFESDKAAARQMLRRGRHIDPATGGGGHIVVLIAQRYVGLDKTAREQCSRLYAFNQGPSDGKLLAEDWVCPVLAGVPGLPRLHYIRVDRQGLPKRGVVKP